MRLLVGCLLLLAWPAFAAAGERILALSPHACEMLYAVGAGGEIVGRGDYCDYPKAVLAFPDVGNSLRIDVEAALRLHPTMAVVMDATTPGVAALARMGVRIVASHPTTVAGILSDMRRLAGVSGHGERGRQVAAALKQRLDALSRRVSGKRERVFYELWPQPLMTVGHRSFINDLLRRAGLRNVFGALPMESPRVGIEAVLRARPRIVIVPDEKRDVAARTRFWHKWLGPKVRVIGMPPDLLQRPGPRIVDGLEMLVKRIGSAG